MLLKMLSLLWLFNGAPFAQNFSQNWLNSLEVPRLVKSSILAANENKGLVTQLEAKVLSKKIVHVSQCLDIDPIVFTALIWRESHFKHQSKSETGAVGLTQLTKTGIEEVLDRLASQSIRRRDDLRNQMTACYPSLMKSIPASLDFVDLSEWKRKVAASPELSLIFGAALLKINLTSDYRTALAKYNGDPRVKVQFAEDVLVLATWITSSFTLIPPSSLNNSKFLASIQGI
jgi:hypothetical protein